MSDFNLAEFDAARDQFDAAYRLSFAPAVQALFHTDPELRGDLAFGLAKQGFVIDVPIMVWGWDAYVTMLLRETGGYTWVPSALQDPVAVAPGLSFPGLKGYDPSVVPAGSVKVSTKISDYPAFEHPVVQLPQGASTKLIGQYMGYGKYYQVPQTAKSLPDGYPWSEDGYSYTLHVTPTLFGVWYAWERK